MEEFTFALPAAFLVFSVAIFLVMIEGAYLLLRVMVRLY